MLAYILPELLGDVLNLFQAFCKLESQNVLILLLFNNTNRDRRYEVSPLIIRSYL